MTFEKSNYSIVRASDVDGIGVEIFRKGSSIKKDEFVCGIFRDDTQRKRTVMLDSKEVSLEELEGFIQIFKDMVDWEFMDENY